MYTIASQPLRDNIQQHSQSCPTHYLSFQLIFRQLESRIQALTTDLNLNFSCTADQPSDFGESSNLLDLHIISVQSLGTLIPKAQALLSGCLDLIRGSLVHPNTPARLDF